MASEIARTAQEADRKGDEGHQRYLVAEEERRRKELEELRAKSAAESRQQLLGIIESWVTARQVEQFFEDLNESREALGSEERAVVDGRIERARAMFGGADASRNFRKWATPEDFLRERQ